MYPLPNRALQHSLDPGSRLTVAKQQPASSAAELRR